MVKLSNTELLKMHMDCMFTYQNNRMVYVNEPWGSTVPAPLLVVGRTTEGEIVHRFGLRASTGFIREAEALLSRDIWDMSIYRKELGIDSVSRELCFCVSSSAADNTGCRLLTSEDAPLLEAALQLILRIVVFIVFLVRFYTLNYHISYYVFVFQKVIKYILSARACFLPPMNNIYFAIYNPATDSIEIYTGEKLKIIFNCTRLNKNVYLDDLLDIAYLHRLASEEPFNYIYFALQPDGLQEYVEAMNVFN